VHSPFEQVRISSMVAVLWLPSGTDQPASPRDVRVTRRPAAKGIGSQLSESGSAKPIPSVRSPIGIKIRLRKCSQGESLQVQLCDEDDFTFAQDRVPTREGA
jgi:hypothetical protein